MSIVRHPSPQRRGAILIVAMVVLFTLAAMVLVLGRSMRVEAMASANQAAEAQASAIERGAEQYVLAAITDSGGDMQSLAEEDFDGIPVGDGLFWVLRPDYGDPDLPVFGLVDENSKLDINSASVDSLMKLPNMTEDIAAAIVDWRDEDSTPVAGGAENEYYLALPDPYYCKNARFETVEELLMVRGMTAEYLYGDGSAQPLGTGSGVFGRSGGDTLTTDEQLGRGIYNLLTVSSTQPNRDADGQQRININSGDQRNRLRELIRDKLDKERAEAVIRELPGTSRRERFRDIFDFYFRMKLKPDEFDLLADSITTTGDQFVSGQVNVNTAPREVLACVEGLTSDDVEKLLAQRSSVGSTPGTGLGWVAEALGERAIGLGSRITGRSSVYSADILAVSGNGRAFERCRVVFSVNGTDAPRITYRRDLTDRGWPMDQQILAEIRAGGASMFAGAGMGMGRSLTGGGVTR